MQKMKKPVVVALVAAFGLSVAACSTGSTVGGLAGGTLTRGSTMTGQLTG